jgi:hypothetical protein
MEDRKTPFFSRSTGQGLQSKKRAPLSQGLYAFRGDFQWKICNFYLQSIRPKTQPAASGLERQRKSPLSRVEIGVAF